MAIVNFLRFNKNSGGIISDREFWNVFFRKRVFTEHLYTLVVPSESENEPGIIYGGVGYPEVHSEVVKRTKQIISKQKVNEISVKDIAEYAFKKMQEVVRKKIDEKMLMFLGFTTEDLHRGYFYLNEKKIEINTKAVRSEALKWLKKEKSDNLLKYVLNVKAVVFGFDKNGISGYHLAAENSVLGYVHEGFETIGSGKYASGLSFSSVFKTKNFKMRQEGFSKASGIFELLKATITARDHFKEIGGGFQFAILDKNETLENKIVYFKGDEAKLAEEIVTAHLYNLLSYSETLELLDNLITFDKTVQEIEQTLFRKSTDSTKLEFLLRGYKFSEVEKGLLF